MNKKRIYLDNSATTPTRPEVIEAMLPMFGQIYGNASSVHTFGQESRKAMEDARTTIAHLINAAKPEEIIITGSGTEADNFAIKGVAWANREKGNHIITTEIEHHAVLYTCEFLQKHGFNVTYLGVDQYGRVKAEDLKAAITPQTILVSIMHANNETGTIQPIKEIGEIIARENSQRFSAGKQRIYFHTDAVQTAGKLKLDVQDLGVDLLTFSGHKFNGPKGVGALYLRRGTLIQPIIHGGHHERNLRAGTENVPGIVGMAKALELACAEMDAEHAHLLKLRNKLEQGVLAAIPSVRINGHLTERLASVMNASFECIEGESLLLSLDLEGVATSTGSACASGSLETSHVLNAMCVDPAVAQGTLRFSLGRQNTEEEIDFVVGILPRLVSRLRDMSPLWEQRKK